MLDKAVDVFWRRGFEATAIADLCHATQLNPGSIYAAFGSKHGLFIAALKRYVQSVSAAAIAVLDETASGDVAIRAYFTALVDAMVDGRRRSGCLMTNTLIEQHATDKDIAALMVRHLANLEAAFDRALVREGVESTDAAARAAGLVCFVQGLNVLAKARPGRARLEALVASALQAFLRPTMPGMFCIGASI